MMEILETQGPICHSPPITPQTTYLTKSNGPRPIFRCLDCNASLSETNNRVVEGLRTPLRKSWEVLHARTEGMGLNAAARVFHKGKRSLLAWERRFGPLQQVRLISALVQPFLEGVLAGDEAYPKGPKDLPPQESQGGTIALRARASRVLWDREWGDREESLFRHAVERLEVSSEQTKDLSLCSDGERRYGNLWFALCSEVGRPGKPGRPKTPLKPGGTIRVQNPGDQARKNGRKKPQYQAPWAEQPETSKAVDSSSSHANHLEAFWSALRRKCSAFRRRPNTSAKSQGGLPRL